MKGHRQPTDLKERVTHVLDELRVVLPGTQALLGFQFVGIFSQGFMSLAEWVRYVHLASLGLVILTTVLLMAPAARHRIVERGQDSEALHSFASRMLLWAMATLALGVCGDLFVVLDAVTKDAGASAAIAAIGLAVIYVAWFGSFFLKAPGHPRCAARLVERRPSVSATHRPLLNKPKG